MSCGDKMVVMPGGKFSSVLKEVVKNENKSSVIQCVVKQRDENTRAVFIDKDVSFGKCTKKILGWLIESPEDGVYFVEEDRFNSLFEIVKEVEGDKQ